MWPLAETKKLLNYFNQQRKVSQIWFNIQGFLFPFIEKEIE